MGIIKSIIEILKGGRNAGKPEDSVPGGNGCEHRSIYPFETVCEQAVSDFCRVRMLAAACAAERSGDSGALPSDPIRRENLALINAARKTGVLLDDDNAIRFIDPIIGFKQPLVDCLAEALESDDMVKELVGKICGK